MATVDTAAVCTPGKRPRPLISEFSHAKSLVDCLYESITTKTRLSALNTLRHALHHDSAMADALQQAGLGRALVLQWNWILQQHGSVILEATALLDVVLHWTSLLSTTDVTTWMESHPVLDLCGNAIQRGIVTSVAALLHLLSSSYDRAVVMVCHVRSLHRVVAVLQQHGQPPQPNDGDIVELLGLLQNLTCYAEDDRDRLLRVPNFLNALSHLATLQLPLSAKAMDRLSAIFRNLALSMNTRRTLIQDATFLTALHCLCRPNMVNCTRHVLQTLICLSMEGDCCMLLVFHGDGMLLSQVQQTMRHGDETSRKRAVRLLRTWASHEHTGYLLSQGTPLLLRRLSHMATHDPSPTVQREAATAVTQLSQWAAAGTVETTYSDAVLDALTLLAQSRHTPGEALARALYQYGQRWPAALAQRSLLVQAVTDLARHGSLVAQEAACGCLAVLVKVRQAFSVQRVVDDIVPALLHNAQYRPHDFSQRRQHAVQVLLHLTNTADATLRARLAPYFPELLPILVRVSHQEERQSGDEDKAHVIAARRATLTLINEL